MILCFEEELQREAGPCYVSGLLFFNSTLAKVYMALDFDELEDRVV